MAEVLELIRKLAQDGMTMIIVTHEMAFAREVADQILFLDKGGIIEKGTPGVLLTNPKHRRTKLFLKAIL